MNFENWANIEEKHAKVANYLFAALLFCTLDYNFI